MYAEIEIYKLKAYHSYFLFTQTIFFTCVCFLVLLHCNNVVKLISDPTILFLNPESGEKHHVTTLDEFRDHLGKQLSFYFKNVSLSSYQKSIIPTWSVPLVY